VSCQLLHILDYAQKTENTWITINQCPLSDPLRRGDLNEIPAASLYFRNGELRNCPYHSGRADRKLARGCAKHFEPFESANTSARETSLQQENDDDMGVLR
jgi:hypothetical protein